MSREIKNRVRLAFFIIAISASMASEQTVSVIPQPSVLNEQPGQFIINANTRIAIIPSTSETREVAEYLRNFLSKATDFKLAVADQPADNTIALQLNPNAFKNSEAYTLTVLPERITIEAAGTEGLFYAAQTLRQLLPKVIEMPAPLEGVKWSVPAVEIQDEPRFSWRGLMLDESRHFFGKEAVKKLLDRMALYKLNRFHWHLTDEPAWRIEIKQYPRLTEIGAKGSWSDSDAAPQFYTQQDIREIVAYAAERKIIIIPEIDMPGHATAANHAYPEYSGGGSKKLPDFTFNPGKEETYAYLNTILGEVAELFPGPWLHYGGDEVHYGNQQWNNDPHIRNKMKKEGLENIRQMEHYFNRRMAETINRLGKTTIGWDEIIDADVPASQSVIMWWRHNKPQQLSKALEKGYRTVLCPRIPCYFDLVQHDSHKWGRRWGGFNSVESVYQYPVFPKEYTPEQHKHILGLQANIWTERVQNTTRLEFMIYPRIAALSEAAWTRAGRKDLDDFKKRLPALLARHDILGDYYFNCFDPAKTPEPKGSDKK